MSQYRQNREESLRPCVYLLRTNLSLLRFVILFDEFVGFGNDVSINDRSSRLSATHRWTGRVYADGTGREGGRD